MFARAIPNCLESAVASRKVPGNGIIAEVDFGGGSNTHVSDFATNRELRIRLCQFCSKITELRIAWTHGCICCNCLPSNR